jgi:hypothetical protein
MPFRPSQLWKQMTPAQRLAGADAFWRETENDIEAQHAEAIITLAKRMNFRPKSMQALPVERRARMLAQVSEVSDAVATRALIAYHFTTRRDLMAAFLDALGIAHENGLIKDESVAGPSKERLIEAIAKIRESFPAEDVDLYMRTLATLDGDTWASVDDALAAAGPATA